MGLSPILRVSVEGVRAEMLHHLGLMQDDMKRAVEEALTPERVSALIKNEIEKQLPDILSKAVRDALEWPIRRSLQDESIAAAVKGALLKSMTKEDDDAR